MKAALNQPGVLIIEGTEVRDWRETLRKRVEGYQYTPQFKNQVWDGYWRPGSEPKYVKNNSWRMKVGRGLLARFCDDFPQVIVADHSPLPSALNFSSFDLGDLRDYQKRSLALIATERYGRIALATNAGKGAIIAIAAAAAVKAGYKVGIFCDEVSVFHALKEEVKKWAPETELGLVEAGRNDVPTQDVVLAMVPTLDRRRTQPDWSRWLHNIGMALLDEADRATATRWRKIIRKMPDNHFRIGFSGSFMAKDTSDTMLQEEIMGPVLIRVRNKELVERKISARPFVQLIPHTVRIPWIALSQWHNMGGAERRLWIYDQTVVYNDSRHELITQLLHPDEANAVVVNRIVHGENLAEILPDSVYLQGSDSKEHRLEVLERFKNGEFQNLITTKILDRGTNLLGHTVGLIFASGEGSDVQTLQRIGRGLRRGDGKEFLFLRDVIDRGHRYLERATKKRMLVYNEEDFDVRIIFPEDIGWGMSAHSPNKDREAASA